MIVSPSSTSFAAAWPMRRFCAWWCVSLMLSGVSTAREVAFGRDENEIASGEHGGNRRGAAEGAEFNRTADESLDGNGAARVHDLSVEPVFLE